jgi:SpoVK/Ycf46/Vps4 family AAA+-type ATPase
MVDIDADFVHLAKFALEGRQDDVLALAKRTLRQLVARRPDLAHSARELLAVAHEHSSPARAVGLAPLPVDSDSRLELLRRENPVSLPVEPSWPEGVSADLNAVLLERARLQTLADAGLRPTTSLLFVGPPGVGKTLAARWLARSLGRPLLVLDLAAVMSSFLGRTGSNLRVVLDYARKHHSVLLLDEFDAIAKRRNDESDVGELKRLVTVILQSIEDWPSSGLLIGATNHPELLDPAVWRRFDRTIQFPQPSAIDLERAIHLWLGGHIISSELATALVQALLGLSFSDADRALQAVRRQALLHDEPLEDSLFTFAASRIRDSDQESKLSLAKVLATKGFSQRRISDLTRVSRDTLRKHVAVKEDKPGGASNG